MTIRESLTKKKRKASIIAFAAWIIFAFGSILNSKHYAEISSKRSIYAELENLFRFVALAKILKHREVQEKAGLSLDPLLKQIVRLRINMVKGRSDLSGLKEIGSSAPSISAFFSSITLLRFLRNVFITLLSLPIPALSRQ